MPEGCPTDVLCFTRIDTTQVGINANCTRLHPNQINPHWALRVDGHATPTAQCVQTTPRVTEELTLSTKTASDIQNDPFSVSEHIVPNGTVVILPADQPPDTLDSTRLGLDQVMLIMYPLESKLILCVEGDLLFP